MSYEIGTAENYADLMTQFRRFITGAGTTGAPTYTGAGNGTIEDISASPSSVTEIWTLTCTGVATPGAETWSVTGSISGSKAVATTGVAYDNGLIAFVITAGSTAFTVNDAFTVAVTQGAMSAAGYAWAELSHIAENTGSGVNEQLYLKAPGSSGTDQIFVNLRRYSSASSDYYNWGITGAAAYNSAEPYTNQPGGSPEVHLTLIDSAIPYWFIANGRRFIIIAKVSTVYVAAYAGYILPAALPSEYPYPLFVGANASSATRWSTTGYNNRNFWDCGPGTAQMRLIDGTWYEISNFNSSNPTYRDGSGGQVWPWNVINNIAPALDGSYPLTYADVYDKGNGGAVYGTLDGVYHVSGFSNASEDRVTVGGVDHLVVQNTYNTDIDAYAAIVLE